LHINGLDTDGPGTGIPRGRPHSYEKNKIPEEKKEQIRTLQAVCYSNMAQCHLKNQNFQRAFECSDDALKKDPKNVKAKFRRAQAKLELGNIAGAELDLSSLPNQNGKS
jgi:lipopolysaccharide biosynthesis regulator YciM